MQSLQPRAGPRWSLAPVLAAEIGNAAMYEGFLAMELPDDVRQVFTTNRDASDENHLPAFQRCAS